MNTRTRQRILCTIGIGMVMALQVVLSAPVRDSVFGPEPDYRAIPTTLSPPSLPPERAVDTSMLAEVSSAEPAAGMER